MTRAIVTAIVLVFACIVVLGISCAHLRQPASPYTNLIGKRATLKTTSFVHRHTDGSLFLTFFERYPNAEMITEVIEGQVVLIQDVRRVRNVTLVKSFAEHSEFDDIAYVSLPGTIFADRLVRCSVANLEVK